MIICKKQTFVNVVFITGNKRLLKHFNFNSQHKYIYFKSKFQLLKTLLLKKIEYDILLAARIDASEFQMLHHLGSHHSLYTFDEGLFTILKDSRYNSSLKFGKKEMRKKIVNFFFGFPIPITQYFQITSRHFTWFSPESFNKSVIKKEKITKISDTEAIEPINKIFIGQPWHFMHFNTDNIHDLAETINKININLYISHPREELFYISKLLKPSIEIISLEQDIESFINKLNLTNEIKIYTFASSAVIQLNKGIEINLVKLENIHVDTKKIQLNLIKALNELSIEFEAT